MPEQVWYNTYIQPIEDRMIRSIWRIVREDNEVEDVMQNALYIVWKKKHRIETHPNPSALIIKICIDTSYDWLRKKIRTERKHQNEELLSNVISILPKPFDNVIFSEQENEIRVAIKQLPKKQAQAILMRIVDDMSYDQIAQALNCSEATVRIHIHRARKRLTKALSHLCPAVKTRTKCEKNHAAR
jgi:RNA polymerase sigma-70 factor (ECF subfamily)